MMTTVHKAKSEAQVSNSTLQFPTPYRLRALSQAAAALSVLVSILMANPAQARELELRVAIEQDVSQVEVGGSTDTMVKDGSGRVLGEIQGGTGLVASTTGQSIRLGQWQADSIWIEPENDGYIWIGGKWYRGKARVVPTASGLTAVNYVDLEEYLYSVVGGEVPTNWPLESLKAQAVAARSYALYQRQSSANTVFDVGDTTRWQFYAGIEEETASTQAAVQGTLGQVLTYNGQIINAVFHSSSGGHTENVEDVWQSPLPYLRGVPDYDQDAPVFRWSVNLTADQVRQVAPGIGNVVAFEPERQTPQGRVVAMRIIGDAGEARMTGDEMRRAFSLRSTLFSVQPQFSPVASRDGTQPPTGFVIEGGGFGHGIGMSQYGAYGMARQGRSYREILAHYYQGSTLARMRVE